MQCVIIEEEEEEGEDICIDILDVCIRPASCPLAMMSDWMPDNLLAAVVERSNPALN